MCWSSSSLLSIGSLTVSCVPQGQSIYAPLSVLILVAIYGGYGLFAWFAERWNFAEFSDKSLPKRSVLNTVMITIAMFVCLI